MPVIEVKLVDEVFTPAQKDEIISRLTEAMAAVQGERVQRETWVIIEDVLSGDVWHVGCRAEPQGRCVALFGLGDG